MGEQGRAIQPRLQTFGDLKGHRAPVREAECQKARAPTGPAAGEKGTPVGHHRPRSAPSLQRGVWCGDSSGGRTGLTQQAGVVQALSPAHSADPPPSLLIREGGSLRTTPAPVPGAPSSARAHSGVRWRPPFLGWNSAAFCFLSRKQGRKGPGSPWRGRPCTAVP